MRDMSTVPSGFLSRPCAEVARLRLRSISPHSEARRVREVSARCTLVVDVALGIKLCFNILYVENALYAMKLCSIFILSQKYQRTWSLWSNGVMTIMMMMIMMIFNQQSLADQVRHWTSLDNVVRCLLREIRVTGLGITSIFSPTITPHGICSTAGYKNVPQGINKNTQK